MYSMSRRSLEDWFWQVSGDELIITQTVELNFRLRRQFWEPKADLFEDDHHFIMRVELAGVRAEDIQIIYVPDKHSLIIRGIRHEDELPGAEKKGCHQLEIYFGEFLREIPLPNIPVEPRSIRATYRSGFLYVLVPKSAHRVQHIRTTVTKA